MKIAFENLPQEVLDKAIDSMIESNPTMYLSRASWAVLVESGYDIELNPETLDIVLEPKEIDKRWKQKTKSVYREELN